MNKAVERIFNNKILFSGIGIFLVMLYHQPTDGFVSGIYFYPGFVGVDIFLLFSGYGLCFSYNKNNLKTFYSRRAIRVVPLLMTLGLLVSFIYPNYHLWDYICNMTTLSYYRLGGDIYEWYLAALLLFYLAFPLFYRAFNNAFMDCNLKVGGAILLLWIAIIALVVVFNIPWYYQTAIGRLPILIIGILCYKSIDNYKSGLVVFSLILIPVILLYLNSHINTYFLIYCIAPWIILILSYIIPMIKRVKSLNSIVGFMGEHSLEIYVANVLISVYTKNLFHGSVTTLIYWSSHLLLIPLFCQLSAFYKNKLVV